MSELLKEDPTATATKAKLEVIGFGLENCMIAQQAGAHRIELCDNPVDGGTTPSFGLIVEARKKLHIALYTMIRPRGGDFLYTNAEFEIMKADVLLCKRSGCDGVVTGILTADGKVDKTRSRILVDLAYPMGVTFHRAFDRTENAFESLQDIIDCGFERILTSGQKNNAMEGSELIRKLIHQADGRISIMPGSGVRSDNILPLAHSTGASEFHTSARTSKAGGMTYHNKYLDENQDIISVDSQEIQHLLQNLTSLQTSLK